jgi:hypothetical protein
MTTVTVRFGTDSASRSFSDGITVGQVVNDPGIRAELGYGDSLRSLVNGVEQPNNAPAPNGGMIVVETRANSKATQ